VRLLRPEAIRRTSLVVAGFTARAREKGCGMYSRRDLQLLPGREPSRRDCCPAAWAGGQTRSKAMTGGKICRSA